MSMPIPIRLNKEMDGQGSGSSTNSGNSGQLAINDFYSFLFNEKPETKKTVFASNQDADLIMKIWNNGIKDKNGKFKVPAEAATTSDIMRLKASGFLEGANEMLSFTRKAKMIITTMSLGENNTFLKSQKKKNYTEILASMDKRGKKGYRIAETNPTDKAPEPPKKILKVKISKARWDSLKNG
jgi:hypothetical protein